MVNQDVHEIGWMLHHNFPSSLHQSSAFGSFGNDHLLTHIDLTAVLLVEAAYTHHEISEEALKIVTAHFDTMPLKFTNKLPGTKSVQFGVL